MLAVALPCKLSEWGSKTHRTEPTKSKCRFPKASKFAYAEEECRHRIPWTASGPFPWALQERVHANHKDIPKYDVVALDPKPAREVNRRWSKVAIKAAVYKTKQMQVTKNLMTLKLYISIWSKKSAPSPIIFVTAKTAFFLKIMHVVTLKKKGQMSSK